MGFLRPQHLSPTLYVSARCWQKPRPVLPRSPPPGGTFANTSIPAVFCRDPGRETPPKSPVSATLSAQGPPPQEGPRGWGKGGRLGPALTLLACPGDCSVVGLGVPPRRVPQGPGQQRARPYTKPILTSPAASPFPGKPGQYFFEFLLILATPAPPPGTRRGEQDSRVLCLAEGTVTALPLNPRQR